MINEDQKNMAIMNLQAMTGEQNREKLVRLLEQTNWDETAATNIYMGQ